MEKEILKRHLKDFLHKTRFAKERTEDSLPVLVYQHKSLIRRRLGNVNMQLQENKATNLALEPLPHTFHIHAANEYFSRAEGTIYRNGQVYRDIIDRMTGQRLDSQLIRTNHAKVMYDLPPTAIIKNAVVLHGGTMTARNLPEGDTSKFFDQGTNREALIPSGVRKRLRSITTFNIQNYEKRNLEIDCADFDIDSDCTGDDAGSDVVYVK